MLVEPIILISTIIITSILLWLYIPRSKLLDAHISFLFMQAQTWLLGAIVVELHLIEYPYRFVKYAYRISFVYEYFIYPAISALFNVHFPQKKGWKVKTIYVFSYASVLTVIEVILEKYTYVIKYIHWYWYWTWISLVITLLISYFYYLWFYKKWVKDKET
ncbi:MAG TPA: CBO0543 family protein [Bacillota bacterium]|nr:CBO0543 family protein [Bacillota bacterium]